MSLNIEQLDNSSKEENITILVGKSLVLKYIPGKSILDSKKALQDLINTPDLLPGDIIKKVQNIRSLSEGISSNLVDSMTFQERFGKMMRAREGKAFKEIAYKSLEGLRKDIVRKSSKIKKIEEEVNLYIPEFHHLYFCNNCKGYLADSVESMPDECKGCGQKVKQKKPTLAKFLDKRVTDYLNGLWFEDYIAKLLRSIGWKTWCHGSVMGSTGICYPIDILAIDSVGKVLVGECKSGVNVKSKDVLNFSAKYFDIKSNYGFFFSLKELRDSTIKDYMDRTPGLCLIDGLEVLSDGEISKNIKERIKVL